MSIKLSLITFARPKQLPRQYKISVVVAILNSSNDNIESGIISIFRIIYRIFLSDIR